MLNWLYSLLTFPSWLFNVAMSDSNTHICLVSSGSRISINGVQIFGGMAAKEITITADGQVHKIKCIDGSLQTPIIISGENVEVENAANADIEVRATTVGSVNTLSGDIQVYQGNVEGNAKTGNGDIKVSGDLGGSAKTGNGDIKICGNKRKQNGSMSDVNNNSLKRRKKRNSTPSSSDSDDSSDSSQCEDSGEDDKTVYRDISYGSAKSGNGDIKISGILHSSAKTGNGDIKIMRAGASRRRKVHK